MEAAPQQAGDPAGAPRLRLMLLITGLGLGGAEKAVFTLATGLDRGRYDVRVACLLAPGPYGERLALLVLTFRPEFHPPWGLRSHLRTVALAPLEEDPRLRRSHRLPAARAELLRRAGRHREAAVAYALARGWTLVPARASLKAPSRG